MDGTENRSPENAKFSVSCSASDLLHIIFCVLVGVCHKPNAEHLFSSNQPKKT